MPNATVFKSAGICTNASLPVLYRDPAITAGTLFCYDVLDPYSWPSQAATPGTASLVDLADNANASIAAVALGWGASGGLVFSGAAADLITLPASSKLAANVSSFGFTCWVKLNALPAIGTYKGIAGIGEGGSHTLSQYSLQIAGTGNLTLVAGGVGVGAVPAVAGAVMQLGVTVELAAGVYTLKGWINNVLQATATLAAPMVVPAALNATIGKNQTTLDSTGADFTFYRCHAAALTAVSAAQFIAADYAAGAGRFA